jgi:hypothetical protein
LPLTEPIDIQTVLEKGNRVQIPKIIQYKIGPDQVLNVGLLPLNSHGSWRYFYAKMDKQGRIFVPKLTSERLVRENNQNLVGCIFQVRLLPV